MEIRYDLEPKIARDILELIKKDKKGLDMEFWHADELGRVYSEQKNFERLEDELSRRLNHEPCRSTHCLAGWAQMVATKHDDIKNIPKFADMAGLKYLPSFADCFYSHENKVLTKLREFVKNNPVKEQ